MVTLGCARNEVDSEELAARLEDGGWQLADDGQEADVVLVNTCGFIQAAKQESIDELLDAAAGGAKVVAAGCLAERYGSGLAEAMPEAQILSFDDYADIAAKLDEVLAGKRWDAHQPRDRRTLLPLSPALRPGRSEGHLPGHGVISEAGEAARGAGEAARGAGEAPRVAPASEVSTSQAGPSPIADLPPGVAPASGPRVLRRRLGGGVVAPLKIASGCDRRCTFCAIPAFRGSFVSRRPDDLVAEAGWLAGHGARELLLVSENSTSYGKDLGDLRLLEKLLPELAQVPGVARVRVSYLQPAEVRPGLVEVLAGTPGVARYFDLSFQHASGPVLRAMRRFGDRERFVRLIEQIRSLAPDAGIRSNFIVGFPGETDADVAELQAFLAEARLDAIGVFGYSDEDGTEAASLPGQLPEAEIADRVEELASLADELMDERAADRVGQSVEVLIDEVLPDGRYLGRAEHQAPEVDGATEVRSVRPVRPGDLVTAVVTGSAGVDLEADADAASGDRDAGAG
ncbi:MAG TPA: 30S ribosomal protein S12 methylthiotransferase RimO [Streptosporangiaceae bacterium]|nr:30S ribosomal protein S12 methylthiotransferase RimO [Streptosporangiaceae bacterium]